MLPLIAALGRTIIQAGLRGAVSGGAADTAALANLGRIGMRIEVHGTDQIVRNLAMFSERRFNAMLATALTRSAVGVRDDLKANAQQVLERPKPFTLGAIRHVGASAEKLEAIVHVLPTSPAAPALVTQAQGGRRPQKKFEVLARALGLGEGWLIVPGPGAKLDQYGNLTPRVLREIFAGVSAETATSKRRRKGPAARYFLMPPGAGAPGIYARTGRDITAVLLFVSRAHYEQHWKFHDVGRASADRRMPVEMRRAVNEAVARFIKSRSR